METDALERFSERAVPCSGIARAMGTITLVAVHVEIDPFLISSMRSSERALKSANLPDTHPWVRPTQEAILLCER